MKKILAFTSIVILLTSCATGYHPSGLFGGYEEFKLSDNAYRVRYSGNEFTSRDHAYKFAMRRSAELTKEQGYSWFSIINSSSVVDRSTHVTPLVANTQSNYYGNGSSGYGNSTTTYSGGNAVTTEEPSTTFVIKMYKNQVAGSLNADIVLSNFNKK